MTTVNNEITPEVAAQALSLGPYDWHVEEQIDCVTCADTFTDGDQVLSVYAPEWAVSDRIPAVPIHLRCYQGEDVVGLEQR